MHTLSLQTAGQHKHKIFMIIFYLCKKSNSTFVKPSPIFDHLSTSNLDSMITKAVQSPK